MMNKFKKLIRLLLVAIIGVIMGAFMYSIIIFFNSNNGISIFWFISIGALVFIGIDLCNLLGASWILDKRDDFPLDF